MPSGPLQMANSRTKARDQFMGHTERSVIGAAGREQLMLYSPILFALCHYESTSGHTSLTQTTYKQPLQLNENVFLPVPILFYSQTGTCYSRAVITFPLEIMQNIYCKLPGTLTKG